MKQQDILRIYAEIEDIINKLYELKRKLPKEDWYWLKKAIEALDGIIWKIE